MGETEGLLLSAVRTRVGRNHRTAPLDLEVAVGHAALLRGPNGCGKTTALAVLIGRLAMRDGQARLFGRDLGVCRRSGGVIGFGPGLRPPTAMSFEQWSDSRSRWFGVRAGRMTDSIGRWGVGDYWASPMSRLSAGMRWRCALAFSFSLDDALICLDEPDQSLDPAALALLADELARLGEHRSVAVVASHHLVVAPPAPAHEVTISWCRDGHGAPS